jgi:hypothetical protein
MEFERYEDVIDAYERDNMGYATLTDYIKGENIKIKEIEMSPLEDLKQSLKKGGPVGIEVLIMEKMKDGGRVPFRFGGAMGSRYGGGSKSGPSQGPAGGASAGGNYGGNRNPQQTYGGGSRKSTTQTKKPTFKSDIDPRFQGLVSPAAAVKFDFLKKQKFYNQPFKLEGITPLELAGTEAAGGSAGLESLIKGSDNLTVGKVLENMAGGGYQNLSSSAQNKLQEQILGKVDFGDAFPKNFSFGNIEPTIEKGRIDIDETKLDDDAMAAKKFLDLKDGGRVGFNVGGITDPQALAIYNSMSNYGFSDKEIADTITAQGYDAGTLGQTTIPDTPTTPDTSVPVEGIIGIDLQERDTGEPFNPFGPLDETFTREAGSKPSFSKDDLFGLGRFLQGKERGTLGNRLQNQFNFGQKLPLPLAQLAGTRSPFNIDSKNYNKDFVDQLNYLELGDGLIGMSSVGLKYGPKSVLFGKNVISGFGTNNYQKALEKFIAKAKGDRKKKAELELQTFLDKEKARKEKEAKDRQASIESQIRTRRDAGESLSDIGRDMFTGPGKAFEKRSGGFSVDSSGNRRNYGGRKDGGLMFARGGLATMFKEKK